MRVQCAQLHVSNLISRQQLPQVHLQPVGAITGGIVEALNFTVPFLVTQLATLTGTRSANDRIAKLHARQAAVKASTSNKLLC